MTMLVFLNTFVTKVHFILNFKVMCNQLFANLRVLRMLTSLVNGGIGRADVCSYHVWF